MTRLLRPPTHEFPRVFSREEGNAVEEALLGIVTTINNYLSNYILIILLLGMGIWFTVRTKAIQFRCFGEGWRRVFGDFSLRGGNQGGGMTSFQALSTAIAAQVGTGNIVGACGAIIVGGPGAGLQLIVPESMVAYQSFGSTPPIFYSYFDSADGDHGALAEELATAGSAYFHDKSPYGLAFYSFNDYIEQRDSNQMIATVVNVFCLLFAVILALIAMANVFNTVTNSLILRRREFAVMKSVGLSNRQFRAMVAEECVAWCIRGLVPGVLLSLLVSFLLWQVISGSMTGLAFTLPWSYVALAAAMTVVAVGASVAYGMHRCRADNVVEALRADAV